MLRFFLMLSSIANTAGGLVLVGTWATMWRRVPIVVVFIGASLLIQGAYSILYLHGDLDGWRDLATGALFAGEALSLCVGALLAIVYLVQSGRLRPRTPRRAPS